MSTLYVNSFPLCYNEVDKKLSTDINVDFVLQEKRQSVRVEEIGGFLCSNAIYI